MYVLLGSCAHPAFVDAARCHIKALGRVSQSTAKGDFDPGKLFTLGEACCHRVGYHTGRCSVRAITHGKFVCSGFVAVTVTPLQLLGAGDVALLLLLRVDAPRSLA